MLERDSAALGNRRAARGLLRGGLAPEDVAHAVRRTRARVVHAHNVNPSFGWRALAAAREAGARVVLHLHNYRLVCAQGLCFTRGEDCTRCHGRDTLPGRAAELPRRLAGRGGRLRRRPRALAAAAGRAGRRIRRPERVRAAAGCASSARRSASARACSARSSARSRTRSRAARGRARARRGRLTPEKGFADAIDAARAAGLPLVIAGDGPQARRAARARRRRRRALHRRVGARRARGAARAAPAPRSCPRATPRSSRWRRWRRWRRACRSRPPMRAG